MAGSLARFFAFPCYEDTRGIYTAWWISRPHSFGTDNVANKDIGRKYAIVRREFGLPVNFELLSTPGKYNP